MLVEIRLKETNTCMNTETMKFYWRSFKSISCDNENFRNNISHTDIVNCVAKKVLIKASDKFK